MGCALLIDFGSTYTKLRAVDLARRRILGSGQGPSTVTTDVTIGMRAALADLERKLGGLPHFQHRLACSSAAGGLRMVTVGLVPELTAEAARRAALGAGARLVGNFSYRLTAGDLRRIVQQAPDMLLLVGGTDGGNSEVVLHNAEAIARSELACPIVFAGNRNAAEDAARILAGKALVITANVMPEFNVLDIEPARAAIRQLFMDRIVHAKGIDRAAAEFDGVLMPTPAAVLEGARLLADGCEGVPGLGSLLVIDPGGATTDVHSVADGHPTQPGVIEHGLPETRVKRTVEGDLGMRHNALAVVEAVGLEPIAADAGLDPDRVSRMVESISRDVAAVPKSDDEIALDTALARAMVRLAVARHCGTIETVYTALGPATIQRGKDLSDVAVVVGTGGVLAHSADPFALMAMALADPAQPASLRPRSPKLLLDREYLVYACGLLGTVEPVAALELARAHLEPIDRRTTHERCLAG